MFENSLRYNTTGERKAVQRSAEYVDSLVIPAHFVATKADDIAGFLNNQFDTNIEFYVDPVLPRYRRGSDFRDDNGELSKWHQLLVNRLGGSVAEVLNEQQNFSVEDISESELEDIIETQVEFQLETIEEASEGKLTRYFDVETELRPRAVIPWYVKISNEQHLDINRRIIEITQEKVDYPLKPCLFVTPSFIATETHRDALIEMVSGLDVSEVFLWIEDLKKRQTSIIEYVSTANLVYGLARADVEPHFFYGDFFAHLLAYFGNSGTTFGVEYQESRAERTGDGSTGGGGNNRLYYEPAKEFLNFQQAEELGSRFEEYTCECPVCSRLMSSWGGVYRFENDYTAQRQHYIWSQYQHRNLIQESELADLVQKMWETYNRYEEPLGKSATAATPYHLQKWAKAIEVFSKNELQEDIDSITVPNPD